MSNQNNKLHVVGGVARSALKAAVFLAALPTVVIAGFGLLLLLKPGPNKLIILIGVVTALVISFTLVFCLNVLRTVAENNDIMAESDLWSRLNNEGRAKAPDAPKKHMVVILALLVFLILPVFVIFPFVGSSVDDSSKTEVAVPIQQVESPEVNGAIVDSAAVGKKGNGGAAQMAERIPSAEDAGESDRVWEDSGLDMMLATASVALAANETERAKTLYEEICEMGSEEACKILQRLDPTPEITEGWVISLGAAADEQAATAIAKDLYAKGIKDSEVLWMGDYTSLGKKDFWFVCTQPIPRPQKDAAMIRLQEVKTIIPDAYGLLLSKTEPRTVLK